MIQPKVTGLFFEQTEYGMQAILASGNDSPLKIKSFHECDILGSSDVQDFVCSITKTKKGQFSAAYCNFYPGKRFAYKVELDNPMKGRDDPKYFPNLLRDKLSVEVESNSIIVINPLDGYEFGLPPLPKQVLFCGAATSEIDRLQDTYMEYGVYPDRFEMGTVATLGGMSSYLKYAHLNTSTLCLEYTSEGIIAFIFKGAVLDNVRMIHQGINHILPEFQKLIGLDNVEAAKATLMAGEFDHASIDDVLLAPVVRDLQSFVSFYELQFSTHIQNIFFTVLPPSMDWFCQYVSKALNIQRMSIDYVGWLKTFGIEFDKNIDGSELDGRWLSLVSLMINPKLQEGNQNG